MRIVDRIYYHQELHRMTTRAKSYIDDLDASKIDLGLERMSRLFEKLGHPDKKFKSVHIAGTNGKGSTAAFIASVLSCGGYRTGLYTSPHLECFSERIRIDGKEIDVAVMDDIAGAVGNAAKLLPSGEPTYFEFATAMAFEYFARNRIDIAVVETGLGGRLDATNVTNPLVTVITPVSMDHQKHLGDSLEEIAREKGGIIKDAIPLIIGEQESAVARLLESMAKIKNAPAYLSGKDFSAMYSGGNSIDYCGINITLKNVELTMCGNFQRGNAAAAIAAVEILNSGNYCLNEEAIRSGMRSAFWPGRFEFLSRDPDVILDGAHNPAAAKILADSIKERYGGKKGIVVAGFMADKDIGGILGEILPVSSRLILTKPNDERAFDPQVKALDSGPLSARVDDCRIEIIPSVKEALDRTSIIAENKDFILVTGSLYMVGEARSIWKEKK